MADKKISALPAATTPLAGTEVLPIVQSGTTDQVSVANLTAGRTVGAVKYEADYTATSPSLSNSTGTGLRLRATTGLTTVFGADPATVFAGWLQVSNGAGSAFPLAINPLGGNVGVGNNSPTELLDVSGNIKSATGNLVIGTANKGIDFSANTNAPGMTSELLTWYEEGAWTPIDSSGAGLSFTGTANNCFYTRVGNVVTATFMLTFPTTASTASVTIGGLPFTSKATTNGVAPVAISYTDYATAISGRVTQSSTTFLLVTAAGGTVVTNANMTGRNLRGTAVYLV